MLGETLGGVGSHHLQQLAVLSPLGAMETNGATPSVAEELAQHLGVLLGRVVLDQDEGRHLEGVGVELLNELGDDFAGLEVLGPVHEEMVAADQLASTHEEDLDPGLVGGH